MTEPLLPPSLLPRLERLSIASKRRVRGTMQGKRRSSRFGSSLEFADYREYSPGDDIRRFDWGVYSRTGRPFVRQYWDEQELQVSLYVDNSASMDFGDNKASGKNDEQSGMNKLEYAKCLAASIGYMALASYDRVQGTVFSSEVESQLPPVRGKASAARLFSFLQAAQPGGLGNLARALRQPKALPKQPGMTWIFSDFWLDGGVAELTETLSFLLAAGQEIVLVQVLSPEETSPSLSGDLRLVDSELGTGKEIAMTGKMLDVYRQALQAYQAEIARFCSERAIYYIQINTDTSLETGIFETLRGAGVLGS
ncbi:DUF58 domain-containing protein [Paenibacillus lentus]|uniref:DUF58 domain-containing protein n=1 Tax=Paenibacillus lentus TaxID=1338368 RepID=A0A3S8RZD1_9BACL|nr:DUF58 domain-containing protein [Paenibacillus lentus]AZK48300.1 DUF58 domain-containing protein [Paenibacillus lentus]